MKDTLSFYKKIYDPLFKKGYTKSLNRASPALRKFSKFIKKRDIEIQKVIDVGCAWGKTLKYWKKRKVKVTGVDVSKVTVKFCKKQGYKCYLASATDLSMFSDKEFDLYMATDMYEHLRTDDLDDAIKEAIRVTKKYLLIRPHPCKDQRKKLHLTVWSLEEWESFFKKHGLKVIKIGKHGETSYKNVFLMEVV